MKQEALEVLRNRRAIRSYKDEKVPADLLQKVLEMGTYAPTAGGRQKPYIVAVQDPDTVKLLKKLNGRVMGNENADPYYGASTIILVLAPKEYGMADLDCASILVNMLNAAYAVGLGSVWVHRSHEVFESEEGKALLKKWGFEEELQGVCSMALGYAEGDHPEAAPRKEGYVRIV